MEYEQTPINPIRVGRTLHQMSNNQPTPEVKAPKAKYSKTRGEHIKDVIIAVLIAGIIAFIGGVTFQSKQQDAINTAVKSAQTVAPEVKK